MDFALSANQESIRDAVAKICSRFDDAYWLKKDKEGGFPADFHMALAEAGWLGICIPEEYGGSGLGITDAAIMMRTISESGAGMSGASAVHMNVFGLNPVVVFGTKEQCHRMLPGIVDGRDRSCFALLNAYPYVGGHVMILPYKEVSDFNGLTDEAQALEAFCR